jgi:hypothetical protein
VLDSHDPEQYLVRTRPRKDERPKIGWVDACFLEKKSTNIGQVSSQLFLFYLFITHINAVTAVVNVVVAAAAAAAVSALFLYANDKTISIESEKKCMHTKSIFYSSIFSAQYIYIDIYLYIIWYVQVRE